jgi:lysophospholipase L1-like esterase
MKLNVKIRVIVIILTVLFLAGSIHAQEQMGQSGGTANTSSIHQINISECKPTLFVIGDSTASNSARQGWGDPIADYFDLEKINVLNRARAGRSSRTFQTEGLWDKVLGEMKAGDFVLIQFGHNDGGPVNDNCRARGSLPGLGEETREIDNLITKKHEVIHTFGWYMRKFVADTRAKGATPIILSLTVRNIWKDGKVERGSGHFSKWAAEIAKSQGVAFIDLTEIIADHYEMFGQEKVKSFFPKEYVHTSPQAADLNASLVVSGIKTLPDCPLVDYLSDKGQRVRSYAEWRMTRTWMPEAQPKSDPNLPTLFVIGDSTVRTGRKGNGENGQWGWGAPIADFLDRTRINVENHAMGGTSSRTYQTLGLWDKVLDEMKPGDYVMMQFGHNDSGPLDDNMRARGTIRGAGEETREIDNPITGKREVVHTYGWYMRKYITDAGAKGATSIVFSMIPRNHWTPDGRVNRVLDTYGKWAAEAARSEGAFFVDLNDIIARHYETEGRQKVSAKYFGPRDGTHTVAAGALLNAMSVVEGLKKLRECKLNDYLSAAAEKIGGQ